MPSNTLNSANRHALVSLAIPANEYLRVYRGSAKKVSTIDNTGRRISFPVNILQDFVTHGGVTGSFVIFFDKNNRFTHIIRIA